MDYKNAQEQLQRLRSDSMATRSCNGRQRIATAITMLECTQKIVATPGKQHPFY
jgi:hypothetical protein